MDMVQAFKSIITVQLFFAVAITLLSYGLPDDSLNYVTAFSDLSDDINLDEVSTNIEDSLQSQLDIPVIELGALIFYSGNILIDLILNFVFAIPEMLGLLISGFCYIFALDSYVVATVQIFMSVLITTLYFIGLISLLMNLRSSRGTIV